MAAAADFDIIIIDDEPSITEIFEQYIMIKYKHWRVCTYNNSTELFEAISRREVYSNVWIVDIMMPQKNGVDIAAAIRQYHGEKPVVLAFTALERRVIETDPKYAWGVKHFNRFLSKRDEFSSILSLVDIWVEQAR